MTSPSAPLIPSGIERSVRSEAWTDRRSASTQPTRAAAPSDPLSALDAPPETVPEAARDTLRALLPEASADGIPDTLPSPHVPGGA